MVQLGVGAEAWHVVDLEYPWLELVIEHDIKAEKVAAEVRLLRLTRAIQVC